MRAYHWPGNIRELRNVLDRARLYADDGVIRAQDLPPGLGVPDMAPVAERRMAGLRDAGDEALRKQILLFRGTRRELARALGMSERTLYRRLKDLGIG
ncbi:helix-turn-helix domain-containing protein [Cupriavidus basilensis]